MTGPPRQPPNIYLRHPRTADRDEYLRVVAQSRKHLEPWWSTSPGRDDEEWASPELFERVLATSRVESSLRYLIFEKPTEALLGTVSISNIMRGPVQSCTFGYWIGAAHSRKGYTTAAVEIAVHFVFNAAKLHRCEAHIIPENTASIRLITSLGFRHEGLATKYLRINYAWRDHIRFGMTVEDYDALVSADRLPFTNLWRGRIPT